MSDEAELALRDLQQIANLVTAYCETYRRSAVMDLA